MKKRNILQFFTFGTVLPRSCSNQEPFRHPHRNSTRRFQQTADLNSGIYLRLSAVFLRIAKLEARR